MTNAEKYLKDGVSAEEFARIILEEIIFDPTQEDIIAFLNKPCKPALTEDEKVILRNIHKEYKRIERNEMGNLYVGVDYFGMYDNLFQFIKERRKIRN